MLRNTASAIAAVCTFFAVCVIAAEPPRTFTGVVTDTMCGSKPHSNMLKDKTEAECVRQCSRGPYGYALLTLMPSGGTAVMKFSDQKASAKYAGQQVKVTGVYDEKTKTLKVDLIEPLNGK
jgi:hypothetical protein